MLKTIITNVQYLKMPAKTKNFNVNSDPKLSCTCGNSKCDKRSVNQFTLNKAQLMRDDAKRALKVNSGGRCPYHPDEINRATPADHQNCVVIDFACSNGVERMQLVQLALKHGATAIGVAKNFVHCAWRETRTPVMWIY